MPIVLPNTLSPVFLVRTEGSRSPVTQTLTVSASQTIRRGDFLVKNGSANTFEQAISAPSAGNATLSGGSGAFAAIAAEPIVTNASGVEAASGKTTIQAYVLGPHLRFGMRIYNATASSAEPQDIALGTPYQLGRYTTAAGLTFYVLSTTTSNGEIVPIGIYEGSAAGDDYGVAWCRLVTTEANQVL